MLKGQTQERCFVSTGAIIGFGGEIQSGGKVDWSGLCNFGKVVCIRRSGRSISDRNEYSIHWDLTGGGGGGWEGEGGMGLGGGLG